MGLKRAEKTKYTIGDYDFFVSKFGAFKSANLSGELVRLFTPVIASVAPTVAMLLGGDDSKNSDDDSKDSKSIFDKDLGDLAPALTPALSGAFDKLTGNQLEYIMRQLLIDEKNISFVAKGCMDANEVKIMSWEDADEIFCGDIQDMYMLAIKVIQLNYKGFFTKIAARYGLDLEKVGAAMMESRNMAPLMSANSAS